MLNLTTLNPEQRQAVETTHGPVLILAGAGTGKTRVITYRIAYLIERGVVPGNVLGVTFTNKAAREMQERVRKIVQSPKSKVQSQENGRHGSKAKVEGPTICTFHSLCVRILRQHIDKLGYKRNFVIYDESEQLSAVKKILAHISDKAKKVDPAAVLGLLSRLKNGGERASVFADADVRVMTEHVRSRYESALRACNAVDFDDLILLTLKLFDEHPDALEACRAKYRYVMVDEYQDTNAAQFKLVHALTCVHRNLCVVGDDDQSIYGWRGAEIANLLDLEKHFPEVKVVKLEQNYRSTNTILNAANALIKHNVRRRGKKLWSQKGEGPKILLHTFSDDEQEARTIVEQIEYARLTQRNLWSDHAILFRTNIQSRPLETALRAASVRYHLIGGQSFFDRREVRDFLAYLKMFVNPHDDVSLLRIANVPARGLSDVTMERLLAASQERKGSVFAAMKNPAVTATLQAQARKAIEAFVEFIERTQARLESGLTLQVWADRFLDEIGYFNELRRSEKTPEAAEGRIRNLKELMASLDRDAASSSSSRECLESFLEEITLDTEREEDDEKTGNAVTLITMHSCKGLEFPNVYIVGLEDGLLPHVRSKEEGTLDEERRLFYVAVTRAMKTLTISHCVSRKKYGQPVPCHPSPFLHELPAELVEHADEKGKQLVPIEVGKQRFDILRAALD
ncbi:MAG TPA: UvrD-helicase domain-containing protein [Candidatus Limnocylindrales bacterium]|nr:UvrD-helicase domain-containing protein [Candidatus Limnocylindrales bacterium]